MFYIILGTKVESSENLSCFYRGRWHVAEGKKIDVAMKMLKRDASDALLKVILYYIYIYNIFN